MMQYFACHRNRRFTFCENMIGTGTLQEQVLIPELSSVRLGNSTISATKRRVSRKNEGASGRDRA